MKAEWVNSYWQAGKLSDEQAIHEFVRVKRDVARNVANVREQQRLRRDLEGEAERKSIQLRLEAQKAPRAPLALVDHDFLQQFQDSTLSRRKFLVLEGPSGCGKTEYARSLAGDPGALLELNCSKTDHVDLRAFCPGRHRLVLFDEAKTRLVLDHKKVFQGQAVDIQLGSSATNIHSYNVWLYGIMLVVCSNTWSSELRREAEADEAWLRQNSVHVIVKGSLWLS